MTKQTEAMKLALEALHKGKVACEWGQAHDHVHQIVQAMDSIREALAEQPAQQEPVAAAMRTVIEAMQVDPEYAWSWHCNIAMAFVDAGGDHYTGNQGAARFMKMLANVEPAHELPSTPAQRTWVGLTDEEIQKEFHPLHATGLQFARAIEAKLKEKNT